MIAAVVVVAAVAVPLVATSSYVRYLSALTVMYMAAATAWNLLGGLTGYASLGNAVFFGIGAYATGIAVVRWDVEHLGVVVPAGLLSGLVAAAIGPAVLRARNATFAVLTLTLVYVCALVAEGWRGLTGGSSGLIVPNIFGLPRDALHLRFYYLFLTVYLAALLLYFVIEHSRAGLGYRALRDDEDRAASLGVPATGLKMITFVAGAVLTGWLGGLYALWFRLLDPGFIFSIGWSASVALMALLGGSRSIWGPTLGALVVIPSSYYLLRSLGESEIHLALSGLLLVVVAVFLPGGVIPALTRTAHRWRGLTRERTHSGAVAVRRPSGSVVP